MSWNIKWNTVLKIGMLMVVSVWVSITAHAAEFKPLSAAEKQGVIDDFNKINGKYADELEQTKHNVILNQKPRDVFTARELMETSKQAAPKPHKKDSYYFANGKYKVRITYAKDIDFPRKYAGSDFIESNSDTFKKQWTDIILKHYLGEDYRKFEPKLEAITEIVSIHALVSTSEELSELLSDSRIILATHIGTPSPGIEETY